MKQFSAGTPHPRRRVTAVSLLIGLILSTNLSAVQDAETEPGELPDFGDSAGAYISPEQEKQLGDEFMRQVRREAPVITDEEVEDYITKVGMSVGKHSGYYGDFHFFVIDSPVINAFAVPGGYVGVHSALILGSQSESELASVLAHEVSHLTQRHGARMMEAAGRMSIPSMAAFLGAIVIAAINPQAGMGALAATAAAQQQYQINFTRSNEREADRIGIELLHDAGYDTKAMATFFERLQLANRYSDPKQIPEYLRTHPVTVNRISEARARAEQLGDVPVHEDSYDYYLVRAKLSIATATDPAQAKDFYETSLRDRNYAHESIARYGYALALTEAGDFDKARVQIDQLLRAEPNLLAFRLAAARLEEKAGNYDAALAHFDKGRMLDAESRAATYGYVDLLTRLGQGEKAKTTLRNFGDPDQRDPRFHKLMAQAEESLGDQANSHFSLAEYYRNTGELELAVEQLRLAQVVSNVSHYQRHRIDARLEEIEHELDRLHPDRDKERERRGGE